MANKGEGKSEKRLATGKAVPLLRKEHVWHIRAKPGPHKKKNSVALGFVLRDMIGIAKNAKEAKKILNQGSVLVDGKIAKEPKRPVGLFDLITITPDKKTYRILFNKKGKLCLLEEKFEEREKICKIIKKQSIAKGEIQLTTNDGRTFKEKKADVSVGDSLLIKVPEQKIVKVLKQEAKKTAFVIDGKHIGDVAKVKDFVAGTMRRPKLVTLETKEGEFDTVESNIVIIGDDKPVIKIE